MLKIDQQYAPLYLAEYNATIYRLPGLGEPGELVIPNSEDDGYSVYLDEGLTDEEAEIKAGHAINDHIRQHHHGMGADVQQLEARAHHLPPTLEPPKKKPALKEKNYRRLLQPEEYKQLGIDPKYAPILKLTVIDAPPSRSEKKKFMELQEDIKEAAKKHKRRYY